MIRIPLVVITVTVVAGCTSSRLAVDPPPQLVGAWKSKVQFKDGAFAEIKDLEFLYVFNAGGTMTESSNYDSSPPVPPAYGVWRSVGPDSFEAKYVFYTTKPPGKGMGLGIFLTRALVERLGGSFRLESVVGKGTTAIVELPADRQPGMQK